MTLNRQWGLWGESELPGDSPGRNPQAGLRQQPLPQWIIKNTGLQGPKKGAPRTTEEASGPQAALWLRGKKATATEGLNPAPQSRQPARGQEQLRPGATEGSPREGQPTARARGPAPQPA